MERSSSRRRDWRLGCWDSKKRVHVSAREVVSDPANMNVLMVCRMSSSEIRCEGGRSVAMFDLTENRDQSVAKDKIWLILTK